MKPSSRNHQNEALKMFLRIVVGTVVGAAVGLGWHKLVGCSGGACPLTGNPFISTLYGMTAGALVAASFQ